MRHEASSSHSGKCFQYYFDVNWSSRLRASRKGTLWSHSNVPDTTVQQHESSLSSYYRVHNRHKLRIRLVGENACGSCWRGYFWWTAVPDWEIWLADECIKLVENLHLRKGNVRETNRETSFLLDSKKLAHGSRIKAVVATPMFSSIGTVCYSINSVWEGLL